MCSFFHFQFDKIPSDTVSLKIKLGPKTNILFPNRSLGNKINSLQIDGNYNGSEKIEISEKAFYGNTATFPQISIYNCRSVIMQKNSLLKNELTNNEFTIEIINSTRVHILPDVFKNTNFNCTFINVESLLLHDGAFNGSNESRVSLFLMFFCFFRKYLKIN